MIASGGGAPRALSIDDALAIAKQIAEALEAAHERGIVHRDLKPANIKVRDDGTVKVLDFGLAKALETPGGSGESGGPGGLSMSPTITTPAMTQAGMILGTAAYMSPEQARGKPVDRRTDVWAFGCVLYEMLTGRRAFEDEDVSMTLSKVLQRDPDFDALPAAVPARLRQVLRLCLRKDRKERAGDMQDVRLALDGAFETAAPHASAAATGARPTSLAVRALPWALAGAAVIVAGIVLIRWAPWRADTATDRPLVRLDVDLGADVSLPALTPITSVLISPDGTRLAYLSGTPAKLFTRRLDQPTATALPDTENASAPFFSPDGQWLGFFRSGTVNKVSVEGGVVVPLGPSGERIAGASWADDGGILVSDAYAADSGLKRIPDGGGPPTLVARAVNGEVLATPQVLPGGRAILLTTGQGTSVDSGTIEVLTLADGRRKIVARGGNTPRYLPTSANTGHLVYITRGVLFAVPFDLDTLEARGTPVPVLDDVAVDPVFESGHFDVSRTGTLIYRRARSEVGMATVQWVSPSDGRSARTAPLRASPAAYEQPRLSPGGTRVALVIAEGANRDVWVYDPRRDTLTRLTFGGVNEFPVWSPDGQFVVFRKRGAGIVQARADGASQPQALIAGEFNPLPWSFTPDGRRLAYFESTARAAQIWTVPLEDAGGQLKAGTPERFLTSNSDRGPAFSPDGRWLAYYSAESGRNEVYVRTFPPPASGQGGTWQISSGGGAVPRWSRSGHQLVYQAGDQLMTVGYTVNGATFVAEKPRVWIAALGGAGGEDWDLSPDGTRVAAVIPDGSATAPQQEHEIVMLQNFFDELRRRVPVGK